MYENIKFTKANLSLKDGSFYLFDNENGTLTQKSAGGKIVFQFPLKISDSFTLYTLDDVKCSQYDGYSLWTLQRLTDNSGEVIRRWVVVNYTCTLYNQFPLIEDPQLEEPIIYDIDTFSVEHYSTTISGSIDRWSTTLQLLEYTDSVIFKDSVIGLGANRFGEKELVTVSGVSGKNIILNNPTKSAYADGDSATITSSLFVFNGYNGTNPEEGTLFMLNANTGEQLSSATDVEYKNLTASKFIRLKNILQNYQDVHTLAYTKGTNLKLRNMSDMYRYIAELKASDDFTGTDGTLPDSDNWSIGSGNPIIKNNALFGAVAGNGHDSIISLYNTTGDFDVQVSGTLGGFTTYSGVNFVDHYLQFNLLNSSSYYGIRRSFTSLLEIPIDNMSFYYKLDDNALDSSGNGYHGTLYGPSAALNRLDEPNKAMYFDGADDYMTTPYFYSTTSTGIDPFTVSAWVKVPIDGGEWSVLDFDESEYFNCAVGVAELTNNGPGDTVFFGSTDKFGTTSYLRSNSTSIRDNNWHNVIWVFDGSTKYIYIDGLLDNTQIVDSIGTGETRYGVIGDGSESITENGDRNHYYYNGYLDDLIMYNKVLTNDEILGIGYNSTTGNTIESYNNDGVISYVDVSYDPESSYIFNINRYGSTVNFKFKITTSSGVFTDTWVSLASMSESGNCNLSLGLYAKLTTVSGSYFDDLYFNDGYIVYPNPEITYYGIMNMDNIKADQTTIIQIYDIDIEGDNLYRLQEEATYYGTDNSWATYNYQVSPIRNFIDFITIDSDTHILPATGRNTAQLTVIVLDQYGQGAVGKNVYFTDDDNIGFITRPLVYTDIFNNTGVAESAYTSGTDLRVATITAKVTQYD